MRKSSIPSLCMRPAVRLILHYGVSILMFRWLYLNEYASAEHSAWKLSALRIILLSSFVLDGGIALHCCWSAAGNDVREIWTIIASLYALNICALVCSRSFPRSSASLLLLNVYGTALAIIVTASDPALAILGYVFIYAAPVIARLFLNARVALALMLLNVLPFGFLLSGQTPAWFRDWQVNLSAIRVYITTLIFLFFNI